MLIKTITRAKVVILLDTRTLEGPVVGEIRKVLIIQRRGGNLGVVVGDGRIRAGPIVAEVGEVLGIKTIVAEEKVLGLYR